MEKTRLGRVIKFTIQILAEAGNEFYEKHRKDLKRVEEMTALVKRSTEIIVALKLKLDNAEELIARLQCPLVTLENLTEEHRRLQKRTPTQIHLGPLAVLAHLDRSTYGNPLLKSIQSFDGLIACGWDLATSTVRVPAKDEKGKPDGSN